jgi:selenocysteine-specific elongation factor
LLLTTTGRWKQLGEHVPATVRAFHASHPLLPGLEMEALRATVPFDAAPNVFRAVLDELARAGAIARDANVVRLPDHTVALEQEEQGAATRIVAVLDEHALSPPDLAGIEQAVGLSRAKLLELIRVLERARSIVRVAPEMYFSRRAVDRMQADLFTHFSGGGDITPATFRDRFGTSRKYTIPLLEYCDREGVTIRRGDVRRLGTSASVPTAR